MIINNLFWGHAVTQLVEALHHKTGGPGINFRWDAWKFSRDLIGPGVRSASMTTNDFHEEGGGGEG
jgi:hypothetical protein